MILFKNLPVFLLFFLIAAITPANAEDAEISTPAAPTIAASSFILLDHNTGKVLAENNADVKLAPASLTKIMSVYVVFREISN
ncbi:MAG: serine-type D-Ala-D-Ala carboxypeptidase, partial [Methylobacter sp.]|nr:serine-type D-Ala-D-Ala carboxypeptidase [Methylobacter sp.]